MSNDDRKNIEHGADPPDKDGTTHLWIRVGGMTVWRRSVVGGELLLQAATSAQCRELERINEEYAHMQSTRTEVTIAPWARANDEYVAWYLGTLLSPTFNSKGAAQAYLDAVVAGTRQPEYPTKEVQRAEH